MVEERARETASPGAAIVAGYGIRSFFGDLGARAFAASLPFATPAPFALIGAFARAAAEVKTVLSGDGGTAARARFARTEAEGTTELSRDVGTVSARRFALRAPFATTALSGDAGTSAATSRPFVLGSPVGFGAGARRFGITRFAPRAKGSSAAEYE